MAKKVKPNRSTIRHYNKINTKYAEMFLYGRLRYKARAVGYCDLHKCYLDATNVSEKRCTKKHCKYFRGEIN